MFTFSVPPGLVDVMCPTDGGIAPFDVDVVEGYEFENRSPQCLLLIKSTCATAPTAPLSALVINAVAAGFYY